MKTLKGIFRTAKLATCMLAVLLTSITFNAIAAEKVLTANQSEAKAMAIKTRVAEIQAMNVNQLSQVERKELRNELKDMKKELNQLGPTYLYISGAGLLLIIILLLILL